MRKIGLSLILAFVALFVTGCGLSEVTGPYTQGTYFAIDQQSQVMAYVVIDEHGAIADVLFDAVYGNTTLNTMGEDYLLDSGNSWKLEARRLANYLVDHQGWDGIAFDVLDITGLNASTVPDECITIDYEESANDVPLLSFSIDGFVLSWNGAVAQASTTNEGVVSGVPTSAAWLAAHLPPFTYVDGVYYGADESHGYIVRVEIENGFITQVVFDAITAVNARIVWNDNGTPANEDDDFPEIELVSMTTKQALGDSLVLVSGSTWRSEADLMEAAILRHQAWNADWQFDVLSGHEYFDFTDDITIDGVAGVTMAVEGFRSTFEDAISQAIAD